MAFFKNVTVFCLKYLGVFGKSPSSFSIGYIFSRTYNHTKIKRIVLPRNPVGVGRTRGCKDILHPFLTVKQLVTTLATGVYADSYFYYSENKIGGNPLWISSYYINAYKASDYSAVPAKDKPVCCSYSASVAQSHHTGQE